MATVHHIIHLKDIKVLLAEALSIW